jgi:hypothetical protein
MTLIDWSKRPFAKMLGSQSALVMPSVGETSGTNAQICDIIMPILSARSPCWGLNAPTVWVVTIELLDRDQRFGSLQELKCIIQGFPLWNGGNIDLRLNPLAHPPALYCREYLIRLWFNKSCEPHGKDSLEHEEMLSIRSRGCKTCEHPVHLVDTSLTEEIIYDTFLLRTRLSRGGMVFITLVNTILTRT